MCLLSNNIIMTKTSTETDKISEDLFDLPLQKYQKIRRISES